MSTRTRVILAAHGAHADSHANRTVACLAAWLNAQAPELDASFAFNLGEPHFSHALDQLDHHRVIVVPVMTSDGYFSRERLPAELAKNTTFNDKHVTITPAVGAHPLIHDIIHDHARDALADARNNPLIILVGHGTRKSATSGNATEHAAQQLRAHLPDAHITNAFIDQDPELQTVVKDNPERDLIVIPFMLGGGGHALQDIPIACGLAAGERSGTTPTNPLVRITPPLSEHPLFARAVLDTARNANRKRTTRNPPTPKRPADRRVIRIGTRPSKLARRQTALAAERLVDLGLAVDIVNIQTLGDADQHATIEQLGPGAFTNDIERALRDGRIDLAVHSLKDLPTADTPGLTLAAFVERASAQEALVTRDGSTLCELPSGARVGTSSTRRTTQIRALRDDIDTVPIRGNVEQRVAQVINGTIDAAVLAVAGLHRLGLEDTIAQRWHQGTFTPEAGQGIIAIQARAGDADLLVHLKQLDDPELRFAATLERSLARRVERTGMLAAASLAEGTLHTAIMNERDVLARVARRIPTDADPTALADSTASELLDIIGPQPQRISA